MQHHLLGADAWIMMANTLYLGSYLVREILWLRVLTVVAATLLIPYYYLQPSPLWTAIAWNVVFTAINLGWIGRLLSERRPVHLSEDEQRLYQLAFRTLTPREMARLLALGRWEDVEPGRCLVEHDRDLERLSIILRGRAEAKMDGVQVAELGEGRFVGELAFVGDQEAPLSVVVVEPTRIMSWPRGAFQKLLKDFPDLGLALQASLGDEILGLLKAARDRA
jgi:hypothetical protein